MDKINSDNDLYKNSIPVENYPDVLNWICKDFKRSIRLTKTLIYELNQLFGKQNTTVRGEFYYRIWYVKYQNEIFCISTAKNKGTSFSIVSNNGDNKSDISIKFLNEIDKLIQNINK